MLRQVFPKDTSRSFLEADNIISILPRLLPDSHLDSPTLLCEARNSSNASSEDGELCTDHKRYYRTWHLEGRFAGPCRAWLAKRFQPATLNLMPASAHRLIAAFPVSSTIFLQRDHRYRLVLPKTQHLYSLRRLFIAKIIDLYHRRPFDTISPRFPSTCDESRYGASRFSVS